MAGHGAPGSPHAALLAGPFLGELPVLDLGPLPGGIASGDVVHGRSVALLAACTSIVNRCVVDDLGAP